MAAGKETNWWELEISGLIRNISPSIWKLTHLTALYLNDNCLSRLPSAIGLLVNLRRLDLANNKLRYLETGVPGTVLALTDLTLV